MFRRWLLSLAICVLATGFSIIYFDRSLADFAHHLGMLRVVLGANEFRLPILQALAILLVLVGIFVTEGSRKPHQPAMVALQAGIAMISALVVNILLLKPAFGRSLPWLYEAHGEFGFHPFHRSVLLGSFPSGHAVLAAALASVLWASYPKCRPICIIGVSIISCALILGEHHFLSDLIAGSFVGTTAGILTVAMTNLLITRDQQSVHHFMDASVTQLLEGNSETAILDLTSISPAGAESSKTGIRTIASAILLRHSILH